MSNIPVLNLSGESQQVIKDILHSKTKDGSGVLSLDELGDCLEAFGFEPDDEDVKFLQRHFDDNGNGELEVEEILENIDVINWHCFYGKELMDEFTAIDQDKDRFIRFPEMLKMLTTREPNPLPPLEARQLLDRLVRKYDANFDGKFSYAEFVKIYMADELPFKIELEAGTRVKKCQQQTNSTNKKKPLKKKSSSNLRKRSDSSVKSDSSDAVPKSRSTAKTSTTSTDSTDTQKSATKLKSAKSSVASKSKTGSQSSSSRPKSRKNGKFAA